MLAGAGVLRVGAQHAAAARRARGRPRAARPSCGPARPRASFSIRKCRSASEAICGRCVMHSTWRPSASARSRSPTARAVWPPTPASTSSNTSVGGPPVLATDISASITRESSPPDAESRTGAAGTPGLGAIRNSTCSAPGRRELLALAQLDLERGVLHRQLGQLGEHALRQRRRRLAARLRERGRERVPPPSRPRAARRSAPLDRDLGVLEPVALGAAALEVLEHRGDAAAVLALEPVVGVEPLLDLLEPAGLGRRGPTRSGAARPPGPRPRSAARAGAPASSSSSASTPATPSASRSASASSVAAPGRVRSGAIASAAAGAGARAALRGGAAGRARPRAPPSRPRRARAPRSRRSRRPAGRGRARGCPRGRAARPARRAARARARARPRTRARFASCAGAAEGVEHLELRRRHGELAVLVLAVERDEAPAQLAQVVDGGRPARRRNAASAPRPRPAGRARSPRRPPVSNAPST